jgi:hypothetical protein
MEKTELNQRPINLLHFDDLLQTWLEAFIVDRKIQKLSKGTIRYYILQGDDDQSHPPIDTGIDQKLFGLPSAEGS